MAMSGDAHCVMHSMTYVGLDRGMQLPDMTSYT